MESRLTHEVHHHTTMVVGVSDGDFVVQSESQSLRSVEPVLRVLRIGAEHVHDVHLKSVDKLSASI
jgi:hypothetical protein